MDGNTRYHIEFNHFSFFINHIEDLFSICTLSSRISALIIINPVKNYLITYEKYPRLCKRRFCAPTIVNPPWRGYRRGMIIISHHEKASTIDLEISEKKGGKKRKVWHSSQERWSKGAFTLCLREGGAWPTFISPRTQQRPIMRTCVGCRKLH